jgi:hypothetical protein
MGTPPAAYNSMLGKIVCRHYQTFDDGTGPASASVQVDMQVLTLLS